MIISKTDLLEVKKDYLDKVMIRDGIARKTIIGFSCEMYITFFSGKGTC